MTPNQLGHTAAVLADMLHFQAACRCRAVGLFPRPDSKLGRGDRR